MRLRLLAILGALLGAFVAAPGRAQAPKPDAAALAKTGILERLAERTGVYSTPPTATTPGFIADAGWPQKLPPTGSSAGSAASMSRRTITSGSTSGRVR